MPSNAIERRQNPTTGAFEIFDPFLGEWVPDTKQGTQKVGAGAPQNTTAPLPTPANTLPSQPSGAPPDPVFAGDATDLDRAFHQQLRNQGMSEQAIQEWKQRTGAGWTAERDSWAKENPGVLNDILAKIKAGVDPMTGSGTGPGQFNTATGSINPGAPAASSPGVDRVGQQNLPWEGPGQAPTPPGYQYDEGVQNYQSYLPEYASYADSPEFNWYMDQVGRSMTRDLSARGRADSGMGINKLSQAYMAAAYPEMQNQYNRNLTANQTNYGRYWGENERQYGRVRDLSQMGYNAALAQGGYGMGAGNSLAGLYGNYGNENADASQQFGAGWGNNARQYGNNLSNMANQYGQGTQGNIWGYAGNRGNLAGQYGQNQGNLWQNYANQYGQNQWNWANPAAGNRLTGGQVNNDLWTGIGRQVGNITDSYRFPRNQGGVTADQDAQRNPWLYR